MDREYAEKMIFAIVSSVNITKGGPRATLVSFHNYPSEYLLEKLLKSGVKQISEDTFFFTEYYESKLKAMIVDVAIEEAKLVKERINLDDAGGDVLNSVAFNLELVCDNLINFGDFLEFIDYPRH